VQIEDLNQVHVQETTHLEQLEKYFHDINESLMTQKYIIVNWNEQHGMMLQREKELEQLSADCRADLRCVQIKLTRLEELRIQKAQEEIQPQQPGQHKAAAIYYCKFLLPALDFRREDLMRVPGIRCGQNGHVESSCTLWLDYQVTCTEGKKGSQGEQDLELEMPTLPQGAKIDHLCDNGPMQSDGGGVPL
jgi:hypothetical protein